MTAIQTPADVLNVGSKFIHKWHLERSGAKATFTITKAQKATERTTLVDGEVVTQTDPLPREKWIFSVDADEPTFQTHKRGFALYGMTADELDYIVDSVK